LAPRIRAKGRLKWRDLHATSGILAISMLLVFITTGMPWSEYWGTTWNAVNTTLTPGSELDAPSTLAKAGDLDRFGRRLSGNNTHWRALSPGRTTPTGSPKSPAGQLLRVPTPADRGLGQLWRPGTPLPALSPAPGMARDGEHRDRLGEALLAASHEHTAGSAMLILVAGRRRAVGEVTVRL
jgi:hypothetical protein